MGIFNSAMDVVVVVDSANNISPEQMVGQWFAAYYAEHAAKLIFIGVPREQQVDSHEALLALLRDDDPCTGHCIIVCCPIGETDMAFVYCRMVASPEELAKFRLVPTANKMAMIA